MFYVGARKVKVVTRSKSQTVNTCTHENQWRSYEWIVRFTPPDVEESALVEKGFARPADLVAHLVDCGGVLELGGARRATRQEPTPRAASKADPDSKWQARARAAVEQSIDQFVTEFAGKPYLHRVEHSVHCELFRILASHRILADACEAASYVTQPLHKEWPELIPRPEKGNRRGNFDLCVLSPEAIRSSSLDQFREGRIAPSIAIEMGLDYGMSHLAGDHHKFVNSGIENSYLVHLVRQDTGDDPDQVEEFITHCKVKCAYARIVGGVRRIKLLQDAEVREL